MKLYKRAGARYFFAMANHHDNFDNYDSTYQPWNSVNLGPKKDIVGTWARYARENGLRFGVSVHAAHAWTWYETAQGADKEGDKAGIPYDGKLTKADGAGTWWQGYDPQALYAQNHPLSDVNGNIHNMWHWGEGSGFAMPDNVYIEKFYNRTIDLINKYQPDVLYFDDTVLPLYPISDVGMKIAAHYYNSSMKWHNGDNQAVIEGKILNDQQKKAIVWDIERGQSNVIEPLPWQTCSCIGSWHYERGIYDRHGYKKVKSVVHMLIDIVSKNGNLLLNIPVRGDGSLDSDGVAFLEGMAAWMEVNSDGIYDTRPWKVFGEGPAMEQVANLSAQGFNEGKGKPFTTEDIRFTAKNGDVYAFVMGVPSSVVRIKSLAAGSELITGSVADVVLLGCEEKIQWQQTAEALEIQPVEEFPSDHAVTFRVSFK